MVTVDAKENSSDCRRVGQCSRNGTAAASATAAATTQTVIGTGPPRGPCGLLIISAVDAAKTSVEVEISVRQSPCSPPRSCK